MTPVPFAPGYFVDELGGVYSGRRQLKPWASSSGYRFVSLRAGGQTIKISVHRLVATVFHGQAPTPGMLVRHLDGDRTNNRATNLAWGSQSENMDDAVRHGTHVSVATPEVLPRGADHWTALHPERVVRGERARHAKLTEEIVRSIRCEHGAGTTYAALGAKYGIDRWTVRSIVKRRTWKHVA